MIFSIISIELEYVAFSCSIFSSIEGLTISQISDSCQGGNVNIIVCIKQVPGTTDVRINPETNTLIRENVEAIINPFDVYAIEEAIRIKERFGGSVTVLTMGPPQAEDALREALAMGACLQ